jgi:hypothetical protein
VSSLLLTALTEVRRVQIRSQAVTVDNVTRCMLMISMAGQAQWPSTLSHVAACQLDHSVP